MQRVAAPGLNVSIRRDWICLLAVYLLGSGRRGGEKRYLDVYAAYLDLEVFGEELHLDCAAPCILCLYPAAVIIRWLLEHDGCVGFRVGLYGACDEGA